jgi:hypothetical protein
VSVLRAALIERDLALLPWVPAAAAALVIAENFYKFRSFTLECLAFLATAIVLHAVGRLLLAAVASRGNGNGPHGPRAAG